MMFQTVTLSLLQGFAVTVKLFALTLIFSLPLGLLMALGVMSRFPVLRCPLKLLIWVIRGTPLMLQLLIVYYGPGIFLHTNIWGMGENGRFLASLLSFVINYACYFAEIYRGGIQSIPIGQYEAGKVLGLSDREIFANIILLQMVKKIVPPVFNEVITLVKDTSLARVIAVYEIIWSGQSFIKSRGIIWPLFYTGVFYLLFSGLLTVLADRIERRLSYFV